MRDVQAREAKVFGEWMQVTPRNRRILRAPRKVNHASFHSDEGRDNRFTMLASAASVEKHQEGNPRTEVERQNSSSRGTGSSARMSGAKREVNERSGYIAISLTSVRPL